MEQRQLAPRFCERFSAVREPVSLSSCVHENIQMDAARVYDLRLSSRCSPLDRALRVFQEFH